MNVSIYWTCSRQDDIGLERYKIKDLFLQLLSPTCIIIMTVIQVQHFHKPFVVSIQMSHDTPRVTTKIALPEHTEEKKPHKKIYKIILEVLLATVLYIYVNVTRILKQHKSMIWNLLEFHWIKIVYISAFVSCVRDVSTSNALLLKLLMNNEIIDQQFVRRFQ